MTDMIIEKKSDIKTVANELVSSKLNAIFGPEVSADHAKAIKALAKQTLKLLEVGRTTELGTLSNRAFKFIECYQDCMDPAMEVVFDSDATPAGEDEVSIVCLLDDLKDDWLDNDDSLKISIKTGKQAYKKIRKDIKQLLKENNVEHQEKEAFDLMNKTVMKAIYAFWKETVENYSKAEGPI